MWEENESVLVVDETFFLLHDLFRIMEEIGRNGYGLLGLLPIIFSKERKGKYIVLIIFH